MIIKNGKTISSVIKGSQVIDKIMKGTLLVYEAWKELIASGVPLTLTKCKGVDLIDYKLYGNSVQTILPNEYQQVEYIESAKKQYIDIGYVPKQDDKYKLKFEFPDLTGNQVVFGSRSSGTYQTSLDQIYLNKSTSTNLVDYLLFFSGTTQNKLFLSETNTIYDLELNINDGTFNNTATQNLCLFALNNMGNVTAYSSMKLYDFKIYNNDELKVHLIPCYRKTDNVIGLYDVINNVFYINQGTGEFSKGSDVPSPDAPIEVESVGDKTKNLFDINNPNIGGTTTNELRYLPKIENNIIYSGGIVGSNQGGMVYIDALNNDYISISFNAYYGDTETSRRYGIYLFNSIDETGLATDVKKINGVSVDNYNEILVNIEGYKYVGITFFSTTRYGLEITNLQFEKGNIATDYEPYGYRIPVKVSGKNLFDINKFMLLEENSHYYELNENGEIIQANADYRTNDKIPTAVTLPAGTYTMSNVSTIKYRLYNKTTKKSISVSTFTLNETSELAMKWWEDSGTVLGTPMIEKSETPTEYEPYYEPITTNIYLNEPIKKIGDYADYIDFKNSKVVRNIATKTFDGTETITYPSISVEGFTPFRFLGLPADATKPFLCSHFVYSDKNYNLNKSECVCGHGATYQVFFVTSNERVPLNDIDGFKALLSDFYNSGNPVKLYYIFASEETIELPSIPTFKGTTILEVDTKIQPSNLEVVYKGK